MSDHCPKCNYPDGPGDHHYKGIYTPGERCSGCGYIEERVSMNDVTGTPRGDRAIHEALAYVTKQMLIDPMAMSKDNVPRTIQYIVIRDALRELLAMRAVITAARARRQPPPAPSTYDREAPTHPGKANAIPPPPSTPIHRSDDYVEAEGAVSFGGIPTGTKEKT